jgi:multidrug resistance efflux pump
MKTQTIPTLATALSLATCCTLFAADPDAKKPKTAGEAEAAVVSKTAVEDKTAGEAKAGQGAAVKPKAESEKAVSDPGKPQPAAPTTHTLKRGLFEIKVELPGVFDAVKATPISLAPEEWSSLSVLDAVPHGKEVKQGEVIARLETEKLEEAIAKAELAQPLSQLALKLAELELAELEKSTPLNLASSRRAKMQAEEDLAYFEKTDRRQREKSAQQNLRQTTQYLSYAKEELDQLQKMYAADDLTEETEEIIVTRAKNSVEDAQFRVEATKLSTNRTLSTTLPRELQSLRDQVQSSAIAWEKSSQSLPQALKKKRLEVEKMKLDQQEDDKRLQDLKKDLASFVVKAPHDGIVYYGADQRGKWDTAVMVEKKLVPGGKLMPHEVFMTLAQSQPLQVEVSIPENKLSFLKQGMAAKITPTADPEASFKGKLASLNRVPLTGGGFPGTVAIEGGAGGLYPGMSCEVLFEIYKNEQALTIPKKALGEENGKSFVRLEDGKKREVETGRSDGKTVEVLSGLKEGDTVKW